MFKFLNEILSSFLEFLSSFIVEDMEVHLKERKKKLIRNKLLNETIEKLFSFLLKYKTKVLLTLSFIFQMKNVLFCNFLNVTVFRLFKGKGKVGLFI